MAKPRTPSTTTPAASGPTVPPERAVVLLDAQIVAGEALLTQGPPEDPFYEWSTATKYTLEACFGIGSPRVAEFNRAGTGGGMVVDVYAPPRDMTPERREQLTQKLLKLRAMVAVMRATAPAPSTTETVNGPAVGARGDKVFIVHGHDDGLRESVARFVERLGLEAVILHEQENRGRTLLEKFEEHAGEAAFAIVLLTPDDKGGVASEPADKIQPRARQNVVFELGFFFGALGRKRVAALYVPGVELPSDLKGLVYIEAKDDAWHLRLARELRAVLPKVDLNLL